MKAKLIAAATLLVLVFLGCGAPTDPRLPAHPPPGPEAPGLHPLDGPLKLGFGEYIYDPCPGPCILLPEPIVPEPDVNISTEAEYFCLDARLQAGVSVSGNAIRIDIAGVWIPERCPAQAANLPPRSEPAGHWETLDLEPGLYTVVLVYGRQIDRYLLDVTPEVLTLTPLETTFSTPAWTPFWRVPEHSLVLFTNAEDPEAASGALLEAVTPDVELEEFSYPDDGRNYWGASSESWPAVRTFRYRSDAEFGVLGRSFHDHLEEVIERGGPAGFLIRSWRNEVITNRILPV